MPSMKPLSVSFCLAMIGTLFSFCGSARAAEEKQWIVYEGGEGPGKGKNIVLISGDEEYRSEEALPELGAILAKQGFHCTVLFEVDPKTGEISPDQHNNISGLEAVDKADLMIIQTRFRGLPDDQMKHIDDYLKAGKPVIGLRTATHAFDGLKGDYAKYNWTYKGTTDADKAWTQGFGRLVLGETWINHHGAHKSESTRGIFAPDAKESPLLNGIKDGEIWGPTDVYEARLPMQNECKTILLGEVTHRDGAYDPKTADPFYGMRPTDKATTGNKKNDPMMPIAWTKTYQLPDGKPGKSFTCTCWSAIDMTNEPLRRLIVNAAYFLLDQKVPEKADVTIIGDYKPSTFGFHGYQKGKKPGDFEMK